MRRRSFIIAVPLGLLALSLPNSAQTSKQYVCPPCGCSHDGQMHDEPGTCPVCGMKLVDVDSLKDSSAIPNFLKLTSQVWTAGQPTMEQLADLRRDGLRVVINLRAPSESNNLGVTEAARAKELGVAYFNIPVVFTNLQPETVDDFLRVTDAQLKNGPVLIHCAAAIRVGAFWMIRRVLRDGWEFNRALQEANQIGLGDQPKLVEFARNYISTHRAK